jgi:hypothetical protein
VACEDTYRLPRPLDLCRPMRSRAVPYPCISIRDDAERLPGSNRACGCFRDVSNHTGIALDPAVIQGRFLAVFDKSSPIDLIPREAESQVSCRTAPFLLCMFGAKRTRRLQLWCRH